MGSISIEQYWGVSDKLELVLLRPNLNIGTGIGTGCLEAGIVYQADVYVNGKSSKNLLWANFQTLQT